MSMSMGMDIQAIRVAFEQELETVTTPDALEALRIKYLGRRGVVSECTGIIPSLPAQERAAFGQKINALKQQITVQLDARQHAGGKGSTRKTGVTADISLPGVSQDLGSIHPLSMVIDEISGLFMRLGFTVVQGPEIETEEHNFTGLNIPLDHPSRDAFDTFYLKPLSASGEKLLLRSHTSPVQVRVMKARKPPLAVLAPGRVYRPDAVDASHSFMFHQIEGLVVDEGIRFSDLKGILELFAKGIFGRDIKMRFRPHFFPFTEPSVEVDISCYICRSACEKACSVCHGKGWLEILGAGMVHPNVFRHVGYDPKKYTGFAFGMGVDRIAMLKYGINDIRLLYENDLRFLKQF
jgi:phenylalanyl-tRNA synthetase alpha chain